ncbi:hypothetical protein K491DRAFT_762222 [Lophiostoma macrostomum CBS 122681]|uniref:Uncharacterized protein n=1 Tax=Lophiostoma macrostomum CBS 122681 TaxID=1314788 RepID=A0A6A6SSZ2_9PLEO|nr:hypothetical protein K491DRAFT_762222 [Lophiostoma macrostomum CBS 122681]
MSQSRFLGLPRELRDIIYQYYVLEDGGYIFNPDSRKLEAPGNRPISMALMFTCRNVAAEMRGVALKTNTINFFTWNSDSTRTDAHLFAARRWGQVPSVHRDFIDYAWQLLSDEPDFAREATDSPWRPLEGPFDPARIASIDAKPWLIPTTEDIRVLYDTVWLQTALLNTCRNGSKGERVSKHRKYRYSAAAVAVKFISSIPESTRLQFRSIVLHEDREAVAFPQCHGRGLIPYCTENRKLRIERRVDLWRNAFMSEFSNAVGLIADDSEYTGVASDELDATAVTRPLVPWITEALALPSLGMPIGAFTLLLNGDPTALKTSEVFATVTRDAAWQAALDQWYIYRDITPTWFERREHVCYRFEGFPECVRDLVEHRPGSLVRCNFHVDDVWDADRIFNENRHLGSVEDWEEELCRHRTTRFQTSSPLPSWLELQREEVHRGAAGVDK